MRLPITVMFSLCLLISAAPRVAEARAWTRDAGEGTIRLGYSLLVGEEFYGADFERVDVGEYSQHTINLFAEVGLVDRWLTLSLEGTLYRWNALESQGSSQGVGDFRVGAWSGLVVARHLRLTVGVLLGLPLGDDEESVARALPPGAVPLRPFPQGVLPELPNGDGEFDVEPRLVLGSDLGFFGEGWPLRHFAELELGFWYHTDQDEAVTWSIKLGTKLPYGFLKRVWLIASLFGVESFADEDEVEPILTGLGNGGTFTAYALELSVNVAPGLDLSVRLDSALRARAFPSASVFSLGASYSF